MGGGSDTINMRDGQGDDVWYQFDDGVTDTVDADANDLISQPVASCPF